jgi:hypothetical protein
LLLLAALLVECWREGISRENINKQRAAQAKSANN